MSNSSKRDRTIQRGLRAEPDYRVFACIEDAMRRVEGVPCDLYLPSRPGDAPHALFFPSSEEMNRLYPTAGMIDGGPSIFEFRLTAEVTGPSGDGLIVEAPLVYAARARSVSRGRKHQDHIIEAEIIELIVTALHRPGPDERAGSVDGYFRIIGSAGLIPLAIVSRDWREYKIEPMAQITATLASGASVTFDRMLAYEEVDEGLTLTEGLTGHFSSEGDLRSIERIETTRKELDDFLLVSSFGRRDFGRCVGWEAADPERTVRVFLAVSELTGRSLSKPLIEFRFGEFCQAAYDTFSREADRELLRQALMYVTPRDRQISEYSFVRLYSALETLVLFKRRQSELEFILPKKEFRKLRDYLSSKIAEYEPLKQSEDRQQLIKGKLSELNRVSLSDAFNQLCADLAVDISDLWPVHGPAAEWPLSQLRNKIVHGDLVRGIEERAVVTAEWHLRWIVERILLALFKWPIEESTASADHLSESGNLLYREWETDRRILQEANRLEAGR